MAQTESSQQVDIVARVSGFLDKIAYQEGELVKAGQVLFQLDPKPFQAQLQAARGELQSQQARLTTAQRQPRAHQAAGRAECVVAVRPGQGAGRVRLRRRPRCSRPQATVNEAELNLGYTTIRSPVTGLASRSQQRQGAYINAMAPSAQLTYVAAVDPIWVNFSISQNQIGNYRELIAAKQVVPPPNNDYSVEVVLADGRSSRRPARSTSPIPPSAWTPAPSWCGR